MSTEPERGPHAVPPPRAGLTPAAEDARRRQSQDMSDVPDPAEDTPPADADRPPTATGDLGGWAPTDVEPMRRALAVAATAPATEDVPVGAVVLDADGVVLGTGANRREADADPAAHAEIVAMREAAARRGGWRLDGCTLVVTLEPCLMCAGALIQSRVARVVFGAWDDKAGACGSVWDLPRDRRVLHTVEVVPGVLADDAAALLADFFTARRLG